MRNPFIIEKVSLALVFMLWALIGFTLYADVTFKHKCENAGGISADGVCINPAAIIEVE